MWKPKFKTPFIINPKKYLGIHLKYVQDLDVKNYKC